MSPKKGKDEGRACRNQSNRSGIAILGGGNIGSAIARGLVSSGKYSYDDIIITRRNIELASQLLKEGFRVQSGNQDAVRQSKTVILAVRPLQLRTLLEEIRSEIISSHHIVISIVTGVEIAEIRAILGKDVPVVRAMPNTAIAVRESMTCLSIDRTNKETYLALSHAKTLFDTVGRTAVIDEEHMIPATALCACGIAF
ncbi:MAG: NAD(P)-binding domain-containing protein, partial [Thermoplasmata archaeon]